MMAELPVSHIHIIHVIIVLEKRDEVSRKRCVTGVLLGPL